MKNNKKILPIAIGLKYAPDMAPSPEYKELNLFRQHIEQAKLGPQHQPYQAYQGQTLAYRLIFAGMGILFLLFSAVLYSKPMNWSHTLFLQDGPFLKMILYTISGALSALGFWAAFLIRPEKEALSALNKRATSALQRLYRERMIQMGVKRFLPQGKHQNELIAAKHHFHEAKNRIDDAVSTARQLLSMIGTSSVVSADMRIKLYNQALLELQDKLQFVLENYI